MRPPEIQALDVTPSDVPRSDVRASDEQSRIVRERLVQLQSDRDDLEKEIGRRTSDLAQAEQRLSFALDAGRLGSWSVDLATGRMVCSDRSKKIFGRPLDRPFTYEELRQSVHPADRERRDRAIAEAVDAGKPYDVEYRIVTPAGEERWIHARGEAFHRADGTPLSLVGTSQDITERKRGEEHGTLLANELSHRVKNTLATVQAIIGQTLRTAPSLESAAETLGARIQAMAAANDLLVQGQWESAPIDDLVMRTLAPFGPDDATRFTIHGPDVLIAPKIATALSLALHELATNAAKYGALSSRDGRVVIEWRFAEEQPDRLHLTWEEIGGPPVVKPTVTGFGSRLIERVLAHEMGGTARIEYRPSGVVFAADVPLPKPRNEDRRDAARAADE